MTKDDILGLEPLVRAVHIIAPSLPKPIDRNTRFDAVEAGDQDHPKLLVLRFTVTISRRGSASDITDINESALASYIQQELYYANPGFAFFRDNQIKIVCHVSDQDGKDVFGTEVPIPANSDDQRERKAKNTLTDDDIKKILLLLQQSVHVAIEAVNANGGDFAYDGMMETVARMHPRLAAILALRHAGTFVNDDTIGQTMRRQAAVAADRWAAQLKAHPELANIDLSGLGLSPAPKPIDFSLLEDALIAH